MKFITTFLQIKLLNPWVRLFIILFYIIGLQIIFNINYLEPSFAFCESVRTYCKDGAWIERNWETGDIEYYIPEFYLRFVLEREVVFGGITYVMVPAAQSEAMVRIFEYLLDQKNNPYPDNDFIVIEKIRSIIYGIEERELILRKVNVVVNNPEEPVLSEIVKEPVAVGMSQLVYFMNYLEKEDIDYESRLNMINLLVSSSPVDEKDVVRHILEFQDSIYAKHQHELRLLEEENKHQLELRLLEASFVAERQLLEQQILEASKSNESLQESALDLAIKGTPENRFQYFFRIYKGCMGLTEEEKIERLLGCLLNMMQSEYYDLTLRDIYTLELNEVISIINQFGGDERFREFLIEYIACFYTELVLSHYTDHLDITLERRMEIHDIFKGVISESKEDEWVFPGMDNHPEILDTDAWAHKNPRDNWDDEAGDYENEDDN